MLLSIIIPTYNKEDVLARCFKSLMKVKSTQVEFIIVNDGSTDGTERECLKYAKLDERVRVFSIENSGVSGARNKGINESKGKYISFLDPDDEITEDYNRVIEILKARTEDLIGFDYCTQNENLVETHKKKLLKRGDNSKTELFNNFLTGLSNSVCFNIYSAEIIEKYNVRFLEGMAMGEDCEFNSQYIRHCQGIYYIDKVCYKYHIDGSSSATHQRKLSYLKDFQIMYKSYMEIFKLEKGLSFPFDGEFFIGFVYDILKCNKNNIEKMENREFRKSDFYKRIVNYPCKSKKNTIKKYYIKSNIYRII